MTTLPPRIAVFGLSSLPPMYVRVLAALSQHADVHWFMPSPARGYWADVTRRRPQGDGPQGRRPQVRGEAQPLTSGRRLAAVTSAS